MQDAVLTINEFCAAMKIARRTFYRLAEQGKAPPTIRLGGKRLIRREAMVSWLDQLEAAA